MTLAPNDFTQLHLSIAPTLGAKVASRFNADDEAFEGPNGVPGGFDPTPFATGPMLLPALEERGFKDTVKANSGYFTLSVPGST